MADPSSVCGVWGHDFVTIDSDLGRYLDECR